MLFIVIILVFILIGLISFFGDHESEEIEKDYKKYWRIFQIKKCYINAIKNLLTI